jgi:hypothetical protein
MIYSINRSFLSCFGLTSGSICVTVIFNGNSSIDFSEGIIAIPWNPERCSAPNFKLFILRIVSV